MREVSVFEAKTHLSGLINDIIEKHEEIAITKHGHPVVMMKTFTERQKPNMKDLISRIEALRAEIGNPMTIEEVLDLKEEGRKW
jgi:antitoxin (DNA-binding transcriptional repressor) of toxin-antitoxin stability system